MDSLKNYFKALRITQANNDLSFIETIIKHHIDEFPFTSIPVLLKNKLSLELPDIIKKIVIDRRGGYCFEHNKLMYEALKSLGFLVTPLLARVIMNRDAMPPKTHRVTLLGFEGSRYLVDVGNSYLSPSLPVNLNGEEVTTEHGRTYKVIETEHNTFQLQIIKDKEIFTIHQFDLQRCYEVDFELSHFYSHQHPKATFVNNLVISKILPNEIRSLRNNNYQKISKLNTTTIPIESLEQFIATLQHEFDYPITFEEAESLFSKYIIAK